MPMRAPTTQFHSGNFYHWRSNLRPVLCCGARCPGPSYMESPPPTCFRLCQPHPGLMNLEDLAIPVYFRCTIGKAPGWGTLSYAISSCPFRVIHIPNVTRVQFVSIANCINADWISLKLRLQLSTRLSFSLAFPGPPQLCGFDEWKLYMLTFYMAQCFGLFWYLLT